MRKACDLLAEGRYGLKQIATRVGYATGAAFSNAFKRWSGTTPGAYRRSLGKRHDQVATPPGGGNGVCSPQALPVVCHGS